MNRLHKAALALLLAAGAAHADPGRGMPATVLKSYTQECAGCHLAYPPGMLPAASWQRIMTGLERHYGTDASLDAATVKEIGTWLNANAGTDKRVKEQPPEDRITRTAWFERKHREVPRATYQRASIKSAANCAACHPGAAKSDFEDDRVRIPR